MNRRQFVQHAMTGVTMFGTFPAILSAVERQTTGTPIERRVLGRTGERLSIVAFGGIVLNKVGPDDAARWVRQAYEAGVNHFDIAPSYGTAEEAMGPALAPFRRDVFLSCKTTERTAAGAAKELDRSLEHLRTDHIDLYQFHAVTNVEDVDTIFGAGGAMETFQRAKRDGKVRYLGFSAHSVEAAMRLMDRYDFDSIMFPVNYATWHAGAFGPQVLARAAEKKMGILALKALAKQPWPADADRSASPNCWYEPFTQRAEARQALRFTLSHPVTTAVLPGCHVTQVLGMDLARTFTPLTPDEALVIKQKGLATTPLFSHTRRG